jgi:hypothetical protein
MSTRGDKYRSRSGPIDMGEDGGEFTGGHHLSQAPWRRWFDGAICIRMASQRKIWTDKDDYAARLPVKCLEITASISGLC